MAGPLLLFVDETVEQIVKIYNAATIILGQVPHSHLERHPGTEKSEHQAALVDGTSS